MLMLRFVIWMSFAGLAVSSVEVISAETYPNKPVRLLTTAPGSGSDFVTRVVAQGLSGAMAQPMVVDNRVPFVAVQNFLRAAPDGYNILLYGAAIWIDPLLQDKPRWDPMKDFVPVIMVSVAPNLVVVHPSVPANSIKELIALAKAKPGQLNYGSGTPGASNHLAPELFKSMAGVNITNISYKSSPAIINSLMSGEIQIMFGTTGSVAQQVKAGRLKVLAVTTAKPSALAPGVPTVAADLPGYQTGASYAMFVPPKTPAAIVQRLNREVSQVISRPDTKEKFLNFGVEVVGGTPADLAATMKSEIASMGKVIKEAGIRLE